MNRTFFAFHNENEVTIQRELKRSLTNGTKQQKLNI